MTFRNRDIDFFHNLPFWAQCAEEAPTSFPHKSGEFTKKKQLEIVWKQLRESASSRCKKVEEGD